MPITRYIGREPIFKGKTLYEICRQLRDLGVGRVVYRHNFIKAWPTQKTYVRLTKVVPDMSRPVPGSKSPDRNEAWGFLVYRGREMGEVRLTSGSKPDWMLVSKEEEEKFCALQDIAPEEEIPSLVDCPPLLELVLKQELSANGDIVPDKIRLPYIGVKPHKEVRRHLL